MDTCIEIDETALIGDEGWTQMGRLWRAPFETFRRLGPKLQELGALGSPKIAALIRTLPSCVDTSDTLDPGLLFFLSHRRRFSISSWRHDLNDRWSDTVTDGEASAIDQ